MSNVGSTAVTDRPAEAPVGPGDLAALQAAVGEAERHLARAVALAGRLAASGVCEQVEGLPLEHWLGLAARLTGADRRMLIAAGEVLADLPTVRGLFADGTISWGQVRAIVGASRRLPVAERAALDARVAATVAEHDGVDGFDPDQLVWAVDVAVDELRNPRTVERQEQRRAEADFLAVQGSFDGGMRLYGQFAPVAAATIVNALDAAAGRPVGDGCDGAPESPTGRAKQYAAALTGVCADWLGGDTERPARPLLVAHVDVSQVTATPHGTVELGVRGPLPRIGAATLEALAGDADVRAVVFDGARPLSVTDKVRAKTIPAATRTAVAARDGGCRFPGSTDPLAHCDVHHLRHQTDGGDHDPDNLAAISRRYHTLIHRRGWTLVLDPPSGQITARRRGRRWRSLPRGTALAEVAGESDDRSPPPVHSDDRSPPPDSADRSPPPADSDDRSPPRVDSDDRNDCALPF